ncbi:MAG TPA: alkaline phosphatase family protein, partial [Bacteroidales bacterium]|nr:alkaline phosphatase family protein [Bacteroidales bacterium]
MKNIITVFLLLAGIQAYCQSKQSVVQHVILIGIDGVSAEAFQYASTPFMDELVAKGAVSLITRGVMPTVSAPNWATILSGAGPEQH